MYTKLVSCTATSGPLAYLVATKSCANLGCKCKNTWKKPSRHFRSPKFGTRRLIKFSKFKEAKPGFTTYQLRGHLARWKTLKKIGQSSKPAWPFDILWCSYGETFLAALSCETLDSPYFWFGAMIVRRCQKPPVIEPCRRVLWVSKGGILNEVRSAHLVLFTFSLSTCPLRWASNAKKRLQMQ